MGKRILRILRYSNRKMYCPREVGVSKENHLLSGYCSGKEILEVFQKENFQIDLQVRDIKTREDKTLTTLRGMVWKHIVQRMNQEECLEILKAKGKVERSLSAF